MQLSSFLSSTSDHDYERIGSSYATTTFISEAEYSDRSYLLGESLDHGEQSKLQEQSKTIGKHKLLSFPKKSSTKHLESTMSLHIRRINGTSFVVEVPQNATFLTLKSAIEKKFESDGIEISWPHVWGQFCLSFHGEKLLKKHVPLYQLGIRESDELLFVRHDGTGQSEMYPDRGFFTSFWKMHKLSA